MITPLDLSITFFFVSITVDKTSVEVKVESVLREIKVLFHCLLYG